MAKKNQNNNIDKAMEALQGALDIEAVGQEIQLPEQVVDFESDVELIETPLELVADVIVTPSAPENVNEPELVEKLDAVFESRLIEPFVESKLISPVEESSVIFLLVSISRPPAVVVNLIAD